MSVNTRFHLQFQNFRTSAELALETCRSEPSDASRDAVSKSLAEQQRLLNEATHDLPAYDIQRYQQILTELTRQLGVINAASQPKTRFSFKSKRTKTGHAPAVEAKTTVTQPTPTLTSSDALIVQEAKWNKINISTHADLSSASTVTIDKLADCEIDLSRMMQYTSVTLRGLLNCTVRAGNSTTSLFMESCTTCQVEGEAQQFRIHSCTSCEVRYVCRTGRPVIEDCKDMKFGNLALEQNSSKASTIVDDFSDLSQSKRNWSILNGYE